MNIRLGFRKNKSISIVKQAGSFLASAWQKTHAILFFIYFVALISLGIYLWQQNMSGKEWSAEKKQEYMNTQNKRVIFKESDFQKAVDDIQVRKNASNSAFQPIKDIFKPY
jgi:hypothetical protein